MNKLAMRLLISAIAACSFSGAMAGGNGDDAEKVPKPENKFYLDGGSQFDLCNKILALFNQGEFKKLQHDDISPLTAISDVRFPAWTRVSQEENDQYKSIIIKSWRLRGGDNSEYINKIESMWAGLESAPGLAFWISSEINIDAHDGMERLLTYGRADYQPAEGEIFKYRGYYVLDSGGDLHTKWSGDHHWPVFYYDGKPYMAVLSPTRGGSVVETYHDTYLTSKQVTSKSVCQIKPVIGVIRP